MTQYIITDPCYLLNAKEWLGFGLDYFDERLFDEKIKKILEEATQDEAWCAPSGFGDWSNRLLGNNILNNEDTFFADGGTVCVCKYTDEVKERLQKMVSRLAVKGCAAIFEAEGKIKVNMDQSDPNWTVVKIQDEAGNSWQSLPADESYSM